MQKRTLNFEWDLAKARSNWLKHKITFDSAIAAFLDPLAVTGSDDDYSDDEDRWITVGQSPNGQLVLVVHTWQESEGGAELVRIISARRPTARETRRYREGTSG